MTDAETERTAELLQDIAKSRSVIVVEHDMEFVRALDTRVTDEFQERTITCTVEPFGTGSRVTQTTEASFHRSPGVARWLYPILARRTLKDQLRRLSAHFEN